MALPPLADVSDLGVRLGLDLNLDTRAAAILRDVSARVRSLCGRDFTLVTDDEVTVDVCGGYATLPDGPVIEVDEVTVDGDSVDFTWTSGRKINAIAGGPTAVVTYTHGWAEVPDDIVAVVCQVAGRAYGTKPQDSGHTTQTLGDYSVGTGSAAAQGPLSLMADEKATLARYARGNKAGTSRLGSWAW
jgi:hypothetical protein